MSVYRQRRRARPFVWGLVVLGVVVIVVAAVLVWSNSRNATPADPLAEARAQAMDAAQGVDVFAIEYPQAAQGVERRGALDALARARSQFAGVQTQLAEIDADAVARIAANLATLTEQADAGAPDDQIVPLAEETQRLLIELSRPSSTDGP